MSDKTKMMLGLTKHFRTRISEIVINNIGIQHSLFTFGYYRIEIQSSFITVKGGQIHIILYERRIRDSEDFFVLKDFEDIHAQLIAHDDPALVFNAPVTKGHITFNAIPKGYYNVIIGIPGD